MFFSNRINLLELRGHWFYHLHQTKSQSFPTFRTIVVLKVIFASPFLLKIITHGSELCSWWTRKLWPWFNNFSSFFQTSSMSSSPQTNRSPSTRGRKASPSTRSSPATPKSAPVPIKPRQEEAEFKKPMGVPLQSENRQLADAIATGRQEVS